jgi:uroporphyrin-III C-methyltransferase
MNDPRMDEPGDGEQQRPPSDEQGSAPEPQATRDPAAEPREAEAPRPAAAGQAATPTGRSLGVALGMLALLVAFAAIGGVAFTWWQVAEQREVVASQRAAATDRLAEIRDLVAASEERLAVQEERLGTLNRDLDERRQRLGSMDEELRRVRARLEVLDREDAGPERSPTLAEIEFLLLLAGRELVLADNPRVALAALREADQRVAGLDEPGLDAVRAAINDDIAAVEAVADVDFEGLAMRLASLARRIDGLPLRASLVPGPQPEQPGDAPPSGWQRLLERVKSAASALFRIRRSDAPAAPLLAPDEAFFLYRNVELDLKSARLAVLARDPANYGASLESARTALENYFETGDPAVKSLLAAIEELEQRQVAPEWPPIKKSLELLRAAGSAG